jgi:flagellar hook assembly protein FlgD
VIAAGRVQFAQARTGQTSCAVYDAGGRRVATLFSGTLGAGRHEFRWNAANLNPGVYVVRAEGAASGAVRVVKAAR